MLWRIHRLIKVLARRSTVFKEKERTGNLYTLACELFLRLTRTINRRQKDFSVILMDRLTL